MLMLRNMYSKAYYEKLIAEGYKKLTFSLAVGGDNASNVSDLYVFGKALSTFAKNASGAYQIVVDVQHIVTYYDNIYGIATTGGQAGQAGSLDKMLIAWKSPLTWSGSRNYVFTISNTGFRKGVLFADNIGMRVQGSLVTGDTSYMTMDIGANGEMVIEANYKATSAVNGNGYYSTLIFRNLQTKVFYQDLINQGYTYLSFDLKIGGQDASNLTNLVVFCGQQVSGLEKVGDVYKVNMQLSKLIEFYDTINTIATATGVSGTTGSKSALFFAWRDNRGSDIGTTRNYIFTISNSAYV